MHAAHWLGNLAAWAAQATLLIAAGSAAVWVFRVREPRLRLVCGQILLALCLLLPAVEPWRAADSGGVEVSISPADPIASSRRPPAAPPWREVLLIALAAGCAARALWLFIGFGRLRRWRRTSHAFAPLPPLLDRLRQTLAPATEFALSSSISGPVTFGLARPLVVLPESFAGMPVECQEAIACHELLHVRRHDWIFTVAEELIRAALWFHPAVWWLIGQIQLAREQAVDGEVVRRTRDRRQYLNALLAMAGNHPVLDLAPATLFLRKRHLKKRVALLLEEITMTKRTLITFCATSCSVLFAAGWLALHTFPLQAAPTPQDADQAKLLHSVPPKYPQEALDKHIEGPVVLEAQIAADGHVADAHVISGPEELRSAALAALLEWHYSPEAMSLPATTQVTIEFKAPKNGPAAVVMPDGAPLGPPFTLKRIQIDGLTPAAHDALLARLPVHAGDTVDEAAMRSITASVRSFDEHLMVSTKPADGALQIFVPGHGLAAVVPDRIRVGGNVQQVKLLTKVQPVYPAEAKAQGIQGVVLLEAIIGKDGKVENLNVTSGDPALAPAALEAVRQWQYQTTLLNGDPVEVVTEIKVNFTLAK